MRAAIPESRACIAWVGAIIMFHVRFTMGRRYQGRVRAAFIETLRLAKAIGAAIRWRRIGPQDRGERAAARYGKSLGWELIDANLRIGHDEGDLLFLDESNAPILVEVKSSRGGPIDPVYRVDAAKAACLRRLSLALSQDPRWPGHVPRIDVMTVRLSADGPSADRVLHHYRQAIEEGRRPRGRGVLRP